VRRRKVWRVAAGYSVVGWLIIQFAITVLPVLTLPIWTAQESCFRLGGRL
jgi:hypothetical protein